MYPVYNLSFFKLFKMYTKYIITLYPATILLGFLELFCDTFNLKGCSRMQANKRNKIEAGEPIELWWADFKDRFCPLEH